MLLVLKTSILSGITTYKICKKVQIVHTAAAAAAESLQSCPTLSDPWTAADQAPPYMGFSRQEYWSGVPLPSPIIHIRYLYIRLLKTN